MQITDKLATRYGRYSHFRLFFRVGKFIRGVRCFIVKKSPKMAVPRAALFQGKLIKIESKTAKNTSIFADILLPLSV